MIDNLKIYLNEKFAFEKNIENNSTIDLTGKYCQSTGEILEYPKRGKYHNLDINITSANAYIYGSIHKFSNSKDGLEKQNYNDFNLCQFTESVGILQRELGFVPKETKITNLEFGFNIEIEEDPKTIIDEKILMFDYKSPNRDQKYRGQGDFKEFQMTDYSFKVYNKSKQYKINDRNIIRFELKITNSRYLKKLGITTLNSLDYYAFSKLYDIFIKHFDKIMILDSITPPERLPLDGKVFFNQYTNPMQWQSIGTSDGYTHKYRTQAKFDKIIRAHNLLNTKALLREKIALKFIELMDCSNKSNLLQSVA
tara:strand:+ start:2840 stop:3769 length:930 start_codon:yes stop_codon:yes gene_type:complete